MGPSVYTKRTDVKSEAKRLNSATDRWRSQWTVGWNG